ncbi:hypothetical protein ABAC460_05875 [Asticcacaulis sp. AC460]|uniref:hypothetical protein n=1 Tax=Asticcacaulis sp. AC460 TaxID=1282360 RepID=UPI0003C40E55|nr:hypothetical protein [Asticcacaulis sp. AC460]ESQ91510.1 hypothetical protein ABAC460_05875 [Asticcacaulis sp. AC460]
MKFPALAFGLLLSLPATSAGAVEPPSSMERLTMAPAQARAQADADLQSLLTPPSRFVKQGRRFREAGFRIQPFGTGLKGVCRQDGLKLLYAPVKRGDANGDFGQKPYTAEMVTRYHVSHPEQPTQVQAGDEPLWDPHCRGLDPDAAGWFTAATADQAAQGLRTLYLAVAEVQAGRLPPSGCDNLSGMAMTCRDTVATYAVPAQVTYVVTCPAPDGRLCYRIEVGANIQLTITAQGDKTTLEPGPVLSMGIEQIIIMN